eukprot:NODE_3366_length_782_cov_60.954980_g2814_i0.p1 GENE.NODE_3366_length_782_cov_60.954980_g2814_i0~~NODE_3366_length_782_cov_60.954980_g2814_i0.p1  ORF type:complete len:222 (-),score=31.25 NODE_3366_length_782_cov_60.954980_g2814_i0:116-721(-)
MRDIDEYFAEIEALTGNSGSDMDEDSYLQEQGAYCKQLPNSSGAVIYNALVFYVHGESASHFGPEWIKEHTDARLVFSSMGSGYAVVMLATLLATLRLLDRITCQNSLFYHNTQRRNRIPNDPGFADKVRGWSPVLCAQNVFVRFATTNDSIMDYPVMYSDYDNKAGPGAVPVAAKSAVLYGMTEKQPKVKAKQVEGLCFL